MSSRDYLYLLGVMVLIFAAEVTGHWDYLGHMLDGAVIMFLYLKGKEKLFYNLAYSQRTLDPNNIRGDLWRNR